MNMYKLNVPESMIRKKENIIEKMWMFDPILRKEFRGKDTPYKLGKYDVANDVKENKNTIDEFIQR